MIVNLSLKGNNESDEKNKIADKEIISINSHQIIGIEFD